VRQKNGQSRVYEWKTSPRKQVVKKSQQNKRRAAARRQLVAACMIDVNRESYQRGGAAESGAAAGLSVKEQVGLVFELGLSWFCFSQLRRALGGVKSGLASRYVLRSTKRELATAPSKQVLVTSTGAPIANLALAVQERVTALHDADQFVERFVYGIDHEPLRAADAVVPYGFDPGAWGGRPPPTVPDVHVRICLDKGGDPSSEKIVVSTVNQERPNNPSSTILAAVCPCNKDNYGEVSSMMATHSPRTDELLSRGLDVHGERRPVRLLLSGDYESQTKVVGHKDPNATTPCICFKSTKAPSITHATLDAKYGTLQDVSGPWHLRADDQYANCSDEAANGGQEAHLSVTRPALVSPHPRQIVPVPVHVTLGVNSRVLRLSVEVVIRCCGRAAGSAFAYELAGVLYDEARAQPVPYHGGLFIERDCHAIGEHSVAVCAALETKLCGLKGEPAKTSAQYLQAYKDA